MTPAPVPLASTIAPAIPSQAHPAPSSQASAYSPESPESTQPETRNPELETPEAPFGIAEAIRNGARPHVAPRRHHDHWNVYEDRLGRPALFQKDVVNDMYETIQRYGISDTSA